MKSNLSNPGVFPTNGFEVSLGLHHGEAESGKPLFIQVKVFENQQEINEFDPMGEGYGKIILEHTEQDIRMELSLENTQAGLMKKVVFPVTGEYQVIVIFSKNGKEHQAEFTMTIEEGYIRDSPVG